MTTEGRYFNPLMDYWNERINAISKLCPKSDEEQFKYQVSLDRYRTNVAVMKNEREEGREEGRAEGQYMMQVQIARSMKQMGMSTEQISQATGLSIAEIEAM